MNPRTHPKYVCAPSSLMDADRGDPFFSDVKVEELRILLSGFGNVSRSDGSDNHPFPHPRYMSPEQIILEEPSSVKSDIWALGCTLYYMITGIPITVSNTSCQEQLQSTIASLGPLPQTLWHACKIKPYDLAESERLQQSSSTTWETLRQSYLANRAAEEAGAQLPPEEADDLVQLIQAMLDYNLDRRPTMDECLKHIWFVNPMLEQPPLVDF
ncbi:kinase-like protein [Sistotremastrum suecicum HHB10207 ss-3]|uniref:Kinase-like protein n=1 Tax=Sistotremastrum suecicum HHB10207 ss-3 TaxID=1314776 RepID=A0A165XK61_9AGAM|nr:kinase-like protein [Sistotremastrum suecicum HHB10207 ss-3]